MHQVASPPQQRTWHQQRGIPPPTNLVALRLQGPHRLSHSGLLRALAMHHDDERPAAGGVDVRLGPLAEGRRGGWRPCRLVAGGRDRRRGGRRLGGNLRSQRGGRTGVEPMPRRPPWVQSPINCLNAAVISFATLFRPPARLEGRGHLITQLGIGRDSHDGFEFRGVKQEVLKLVPLARQVAKICTGSRRAAAAARVTVAVCAASAANTVPPTPQLVYKGIHLQHKKIG
jgi:hypothetical protein